MAKLQAGEQTLISPRWKEGLLIALAAACAYLLVSLLSYTGSDPGWSATGNGSPVRNLGGPAGAWLADVFFSLVGYLAYLFPLMLAYRAGVLFADREDPSAFSGAALGLRLIGLILVMASGTALVFLNMGTDGALPQGSGGIVGYSVGQAVREAFSAFGGRLLLAAVFLFGITIFTDLSWLRLLDRLGARTLTAIDRAYSFCLCFFTDLRARRSPERELVDRNKLLTHT